MCVCTEGKALTRMAVVQRGLSKLALGREGIGRGQGAGLKE